jgi:peptidyl-prolyl cis-trans isomerase B (cyclophilin B)
MKKYLAPLLLLSGLFCANLAAQSANPQPTSKPQPETRTGDADGRGIKPARKITPRSNRRNGQPAPAVKPPMASDNPASLNTSTPAVKPPTASDSPASLNPDATPAVKPPTASDNPAPLTDTGKPAKEPTPAKANARPANTRAEPFTNASVEQMSGQCVTLETEPGLIEFEVYPEHAPETVRGFLNLTASGALNTTTFSRIVKGFVIQGGNLSTSERWGHELAARASRTLPDEPNQVKHERGVVSMARSDQPNSATTNFFILVGEARHLDGSFTAFGRVRRGMDIVDKINAAPAAEEKPEKPVKIIKAKVAPCAAQ